MWRRSVTILTRRYRLVIYVNQFPYDYICARRRCLGLVLHSGDLTFHIVFDRINSLHFSRKKSIGPRGTTIHLAAPHYYDSNWASLTTGTVLMGVTTFLKIGFRTSLQTVYTGVLILAVISFIIIWFWPKSTKIK